MKLCFAIFCLAFVIQVPKAESAPLKRANAYVEFVEATAKFLKDLIPVSEVSVKKALEKLPKTEAFEKYRLKLESFLDELHSKGDTAEICLKKSVKLVDKLYEFITEYSRAEAPEEAKDVFKFLSEGEENELKKEVDQWKLKFAEFVIEYADKKDKQVKEINSEDVEKFVRTVNQMC